MDGANINNISISEEPASGTNTLLAERKGQTQLLLPFLLSSKRLHVLSTLPWVAIFLFLMNNGPWVSEALSTHETEQKKLVSRPWKSCRRTQPHTQP